MPTFRLLTPLKTVEGTIPAGETVDLPMKDGRELVACGAAEGPIAPHKGKDAKPKAGDKAPEAGDKTPEGGDATGDGNQEPGA